MREKIVYAKRVALALYERGFVPVRTERNLKDMSKFVWFFEETDELMKAFHEIVG